MTEQPSPLKLAHPRHGRVTHFLGQVRLSGSFFVGGEISGKFSHLRAVFLPDRRSTALLPHAEEAGPVDALVFPDAATAAAVLLDRDTAQKILARALPSAAGEANVTIGNYRSVVDCDHRFYLAPLVAAERTRLVAHAREPARLGC